jgi:hypothetical protein
MRSGREAANAIRDAGSDVGSQQFGRRRKKNFCKPAAFAYSGLQPK